MDWITIVYTIMFFFGVYFLSLLIILYLRNKDKINFYPEPKEFPTITFITPAYNEQDSIASTIKALLELDYPKEKKEIIVVNDGSKDKTAEIVKEFAKRYPEVILLDKLNSGKADSLNQAIKLAKGELIAVVDADSYPKKDSVRKMVGFFEDKQVGAVTSKVLVKNENNLIERYQAFDYVVVAWSRKILDFIGCVYVTNGPLSIYRKNALKLAGGFDPKNMTEDIEVTWHLLSLGYKTKMSYSAEVYTTVPSKIGQWIKQRTRWNIGGLQTINKYKSFFFQGENLFGYFILSYVSLSFFLAFIGFLLLLRYVIKKAIFYFGLMPFIIKGYNPFGMVEYNFFISFLFIMGASFLITSIIQYKFALKNADIKNKGIFSILVYIFIYRPLYLIPYLKAIFNIIKGDVRWYTK